MTDIAKKIINSIIEDIHKLEDINNIKNNIESRIKYYHTTFKPIYKRIIINLDQLQDIYIDERTKNIELQEKIASDLKVNINDIREATDRKDLFSSLSIDEDSLSKYNNILEKVELNRKLIHDMFNFTPILSPKLINTLLEKEERTNAIIKDNEFIINKIKKSLDAADSIKLLSEEINNINSVKI